MLLPTSALAFVPAVGVLMLAASTTLAAPQTGHRDTLKSRNVSAPAGAPLNTQSPSARTATLLPTYGIGKSKAPATPAP